MSDITPSAPWLAPLRPNLPLVSVDRIIRFRDINPDYKLDNIPFLTAEDVSLRKQIKHLFSTPTGTEHFEPRFGSRLPYRLYESIDKVTAFLMETDSVVALATWMRDRLVVILPSVSIVPLDEEEGYNITIPYMRVADKKASVYSFDMLR